MTLVSVTLPTWVRNLGKVSVFIFSLSAAFLPASFSKCSGNTTAKGWDGCINSFAPLNILGSAKEDAVSWQMGPRLRELASGIDAA